MLLAKICRRIRGWGELHVSETQNIVTQWSKEPITDTIDSTCMGKLQSCRKSLQEQEKISAYGSVFSRNHASSCYCCTAVGLCVCDSSGARKRWSLETQDGEVLWAVRTATHPCATTHRNQGLRVCLCATVCGEVGGVALRQEDHNRCHGAGGGRSVSCYHDDEGFGNLWVDPQPPPCTPSSSIPLNWCRPEMKV